MSRLDCWLLCAGLLLLAGCPSEAGGGGTITLTVTSDLKVPEELDRVTVSVPGQDTSSDPAADLREHPLPRTLTLVHETGPLGPLAIKVRGWLAERMVVERIETAAFPEQGDTAITIDLDRACLGVVCSDGQTCEYGSCVPTGLDGGVTDARVQDARVQDARTQDARSGDANASDGMVDAASDATVAEDAASDAALAADAADGQTGAGTPPTCALTLPVTGDSYQVGAPMQLRGSCNDPETGALVALTWLSSVDGLLGNGADLVARLTSPGAHRISLCAPDPRDAALVGCANADVNATPSAQPMVAIDAITQGATSASPYSAAAALLFSGTGSGAGVTLTWTDDVQGALGSGASVTLATPFVGKHNVTLALSDRNGVQASASRAYLVLGAGETGLVSPLATVNAELDRAGDLRVSMIASDAQSRVYVPSSAGVLYRFDGSLLSANATVAVGQPPLRDVVQDAQIMADKLYLATANGLTVCGYTAMNGGSEPCTNYRAGGVMQSQDFLSVLRMVDSRNVDTLMVGSDNGLFLSESVNGSTRGTTIMRGRSINDMVQLGGQAAIAADNGLTLLTPSNQQAVRFTTNEGLPTNNLRRLATGSDNTLWIATNAGVAHFEPGSNRITVWNVARGLPSNNTTGIAVQRVNQLSPARDVVWIATAAGVARLDTLSGAISTLTTADGLPSNDVLAVHVLANGTKVFGTASGLSHYVGF